MRWWERLRRTGWRSCSGSRVSMRWASGTRWPTPRSAASSSVTSRRRRSPLGLRAHLRPGRRVHHQHRTGRVQHLRRHGRGGRLVAASAARDHPDPQRSGRAGLDARRRGSRRHSSRSPGTMRGRAPRRAGRSRRRGADRHHDAAWAGDGGGLHGCPGCAGRGCRAAGDAGQPAGSRSRGGGPRGRTAFRRASADDLRRRRQSGGCVAGGRARRGAGRAGCHELQRQGRDARRTPAACRLVLRGAGGPGPDRERRRLPRPGHAVCRGVHLPLGGAVPASLVQVDLDAARLGANYAIAEGIVADIGLFCNALLAGALSAGARDGAADARAALSGRSAEVAAQGFQRGAGAF